MAIERAGPYCYRARMARTPKGRLVVPETPPPQQPPGMNGDELEPEPIDPTAEDIGDLYNLADPSWQEWSWMIFRLRSPEELAAAPGLKQRVLQTRHDGPVNINDIQARFGGGVFQFWGYKNGRLRVRPTHELAGPLKNWNVPPPPASAATVAAAAPMMALDAKLDRLIEVMTHSLQPAPQPQGTNIRDLVEVAKLLRPEQSNPEAGIVASMMGILQQGIELGAQREPREGTDWPAVVEKILPAVEKIATSILTRRPMPPRPVARPAATPSSAVVVPDNTPADRVAPASQVEGESPTMTAVVKSLARAIDAMGTDREIAPDDFAVTVETVLEPVELATLRMGTTEQLMGELTQLVEQFPVFGKPQARAYVDAVLTVVRSEPPLEG